MKTIELKDLPIGEYDILIVESDETTNTLELTDDTQNEPYVIKLEKAGMNCIIHKEKHRWDGVILFPVKYITRRFDVISGQYLPELDKRLPPLTDNELTDTELEGKRLRESLKSRVVKHVPIKLD